MCLWSNLNWNFLSFNNRSFIKFKSKFGTLLTIFLLANLNWNSVPRFSLTSTSANWLINFYLSSLSVLANSLLPFWFVFLISLNKIKLWFPAIFTWRSTDCVTVLCSRPDHDHEAVSSILGIHISVTFSIVFKFIFLCNYIYM